MAKISPRDLPGDDGIMGGTRKSHRPVRFCPSVSVRSHHPCMGSDVGGGGARETLNPPGKCVHACVLIALPGLSGTLGLTLSAGAASTQLARDQQKGSGEGSRGGEQRGWRGRHLSDVAAGLAFGGDATMDRGLQHPLDRRPPVCVLAYSCSCYGHATSLLRIPTAAVRAVQQLTLILTASGPT